MVDLQYSERSACHPYADMSKHTTIIVWAIEFASLTAIIVLLSTATS